MINHFQEDIGYYENYSDASPNVIMNGKLYPIDDILDLELFASKNLGAYKLPEKTGRKEDLYGVFTKGSKVGKIYSWVTDKSDGMLWWQFYNTANKAYYVKNEPGNFNVSILKDQGAKTTKEKAIEKEEEGKTAWDKLGDTIVGLSKTVKVVIIVVLIAVVFFELNKRYKFIKF